MSCVDDAMATFFVPNSHANCICGVTLSNALKICPNCGKTYKEAIEHWTAQQPKLKQVEADHIAAKAGSASVIAQSSGGLTEWNSTDWAPVTKALHNCFAEHVLPLEGNSKWDTTVIGKDTEEAIKIFHHFYVKATGKEEKTKLLDEVIRSKKGDELLDSLVYYCTHGKLL